MNRSRILAVVLIAPAAIGLAATAVQLAWLPSLPSEVATHWSERGADGTAPAWHLIVVTAAVSLVVPGIIGAVVLRGADGVFRASTKLAAVLSPFSVGLVAVSITGVLGLQRGTDGSLAQAPDIGPWIAAGVGAGVLLAVGGWFALPPARRLSQTVDAASPLPLAPDERAVWVGRAHPSPVGAAVFGGILALVLVLVVYAVAAGGGNAWPVLLVPLVIGGLLIAFLDWRVRIDARGLVLRGVFGVPVIRVRPEDITRAAAIHVTPMAYGGWGLRGLPGTTIGVITRTGPGIVIGRRHRGDLVVTVDDAETAARLLSTLASRADQPAG